jgi:hypothetical protein
MGFLRRIFSGETSRREVALNVNYFRRIRDDARLEAVGEAYRQENVALAKPPGPDDLPPGLPPPPSGYFKAMLVPEPSNKYDPNAIAVVLWAGGAWSQAGYLSRSDAVGYRPLFGHLAEIAGDTPPAVACDAALTAEYGGTGVVLHLGTPGECIVELATDDRAPTAHRWAAKPIAFTGQHATTIHDVPLDRPAQVMLARWAGCDVLPRLTKAAAALIVADPDEVTTNFQRARDYGVETVRRAGVPGGGRHRPGQHRSLHGTVGSCLTTSTDWCSPTLACLARVRGFAVPGGNLVLRAGWQPIEHRVDPVGLGDSVLSDQVE